jgi:membrane-anchored glycerophosphoryl diester phosphodiesterase (GDPDase)
VVAVLVLLIPFAYCYTRWLAAAPSLLVEGHGVMASLRRSWQLSRGSIRHCLGLWLLLGCFVTLVNLIPFLLLQQVVLLVFGPTATELARVVTGAFGSLTSIDGCYLHVTTLLYYDLRFVARGTIFLARGGVGTASDVDSPQPGEGR